MAIKSCNEAQEATELVQQKADELEVEKKKVEESEKEAWKAQQEEERQKEIAEEERIKADNQRKKAVENETKAKKAEAAAKENALIAKENEIKAQIERFIVDLNRQEANFRKDLAKAKELAVHSLNQTEDKELKALLALAAYERNSDAYKNLEISTRRIFNEFETLNARNNLDQLTAVNESVKELKKKYRELQRESKIKSPVPEMFDALRNAYIAKQEEKQDILYRNAESWVLAAPGNHIVFNDREGNLLLAPLLYTSMDSALPVMKKENTIYLSGNNQRQARCFAESENRLFCGTADGRIIYWGKNKWQETRKELPIKHETKILSMAFSKKKNCLVYSVKNIVYMHPLGDTAKPVINLKEGNFVRALTIIEDHEAPILIAADEEGNICHLDLSLPVPGRVKKPNKLNTTLKSSAFHALAYHAAMKRLVLGNSRGEIWFFPGVDNKRLKSIKPDKEIKPYVFDQRHKGIVRALCFSADGQYLASGGWDGTIMLWNLKEKDAAAIIKQAPILTIHSKRKILSLVFDSKGEYMIFSDEQYLRVCPTAPEPFNEELKKTKREKKWKFTGKERDQYLGKLTPDKTQKSEGKK
jgi:WD40 repeat protein